MDRHEEISQAEAFLSERRALVAAAETAVREAAYVAGDTSGNCDRAAEFMKFACVSQAAEAMEWAEENVRSALQRITAARAALAKAQA